MKKIKMTLMVMIVGMGCRLNAATWDRRSYTSDGAHGAPAPVVRSGTGLDGYEVPVPVSASPSENVYEYEALLPRKGGDSHSYEEVDAAPQAVFDALFKKFTAQKNTASLKMLEEIRPLVGEVVASTRQGTVAQKSDIKELVTNFTTSLNAIGQLLNSMQTPTSSIKKAIDAAVQGLQAESDFIRSRVNKYLVQDSTAALQRTTLSRPRMATQAEFDAAFAESERYLKQRLASTLERDAAAGIVSSTEEQVLVDEPGYLNAVTPPPPLPPRAATLTRSAAYDSAPPLPPKQATTGRRTAGDREQFELQQQRRLNDTTNGARTYRKDRIDVVFTSDGPAFIE